MLNKADTDRLMREVQVELIGAAELHIKAKAFDVMTEFFYDSGWWTEAISVPVLAGTQNYPIAPTEGQITRLFMVVDAGGFFQPALLPDIGTITLKYTPNVSQTYTAVVVKNVLAPTAKDGWPIAPAQALQEFYLAMKEGMLGGLMNEKNKSYSDPKGALYHLSRFRKGIVDARIAVLRANTNGAQAWRFPQAFRANTQQGGVPSFAGNERTF